MDGRRQEDPLLPLVPLDPAAGVEPLDDRRVVARRVGEGLTGQLHPGGRRQRPRRAQLLEHPPVVGGVDDHTDVLVVLRRGTDHGRAAHVDQLDRRVRGEGIEVAGHEVDQADVLALEIGQVIGLGPVGQDAAVDDRVEGLHPAAQHLRRPGQVGHLDVGDARGGQGRRRPAARHQLPTQVDQPLRQLDDPRLVMYRQQCPHVPPSSSDGDPDPSAPTSASPSTNRRIVSG